jgi:hypothetical protein
MFEDLLQVWCFVTCVEIIAKFISKYISAPSEVEKELLTEMKSVKLDMRKVSNTFDCF